MKAEIPEAKRIESLDDLNKMARKKMPFETELFINIFKDAKSIIGIIINPNIPHVLCRIITLLCGLEIREKESFLKSKYSKIFICLPKIVS